MYSKNYMIEELGDNTYLVHKVEPKLHDEHFYFFGEKFSNKTISGTKGVVLESEVNFSYDRKDGYNYKIKTEKPLLGFNKAIDFGDPYCKERGSAHNRPLFNKLKGRKND